MLFFWSILFIWNCTAVLANLIQEQGGWNIILLIDIIATGISLGEILDHYKKKKK